jgi:hypothetical protein
MGGGSKLVFPWRALNALKQKVTELNETGIFHFEQTNFRDIIYQYPKDPIKIAFSGIYDISAGELSEKLQVERSNIGTRQVYSDSIYSMLYTWGADLQQLAKVEDTPASWENLSKSIKSIDDQFKSFESGLIEHKLAQLSADSTSYQINLMDELGIPLAPPLPKDGVVMAPPPKESSVYVHVFIKKDEAVLE